MRYVYADTETNGFLDTVDTMHSLVLKDLETGHRMSCTPHWEEAQRHGMNCAPLERGFHALDDAELIVGHNWIKYDAAVFEKLYGMVWPWEKQQDSMLMAKITLPDPYESDWKLVRAGKMPNHMPGRDSLEAWGYRLGLHKGDYKGGFEKWSPEMQAYCENDVEVGAKLWKKIIDWMVSQFGPDREAWPEFWKLERDCAFVLAQSERNGFYFDVPRAEKLYAKLVQRKAELANDLKGLFPAWYAYKGEVEVGSSRKVKRPDLGEVTIRRFSEKTGKELKPYVGPVLEEYTEGTFYSRVELTTFSPTSRDHIANRLQVVKGWQPTQFTKKNKVKVDDSILNSLPWPEAKQLAELLMVDKRIGQIGTGAQAWLKLEKDGKLHCSVRPSGARTGRASHSHPNLSQTPKVTKPYGKECRACFYAPKGWKMVGVDLSGMQLRGLGHYLARWDGGVYARQSESEDQHALHVQALGKLAVATKMQPDPRDTCKRFGYAYIFGAQPPKLGSILRPDLPQSGQVKWGKQAFHQFQTQIKGLDRLRDALKRCIAKFGVLTGLDGRKFEPGPQHAVLNTLLQSFEAIVAKKWIVLTDQKLRAAGLTPGWDGEYCLCIWSHDEQQFAAKEGYEHVVKEAAETAAVEAGEFFDLRVAIEAEGKIGQTWCDTH